MNPSDSIAAGSTTQPTKPMPQGIGFFFEQPYLENTRWAWT